MFEDIYSCKIVGYEAHEQESAELAAQLMQRNMLREQYFNQPLVLHSGKSVPMKCFTMKAKFEELSTGIRLRNDLHFLLGDIGKPRSVF